MNPPTVDSVDKRNFLKTIIASGCILSLKGHAYADTPLNSTSYVKFGKDVFIDKIGENEWSIRSRLILLNKVESYDFSVHIQIATDPSFSQIIYEDEIPVHPRGDRSLWYKYKSQYANSELFVRFAIKNKGKSKIKNLDNSNIRREIYSNTGSISPWNN